MTLPLLRRTLLFSAVIAVINAVQVFEPVALITQGGPVGSTNVLTYHIRRVGIERSQGGLGSAMAVTLMLALIVDDRRACSRLRGGRGRGTMSAAAPRSRLSPFARAPEFADWLILTAIVVIAVAAAFPLAWMALTSLKTPAETMQTPPVWISGHAVARRLSQRSRTWCRRGGPSSTRRSSPR